MNPDTPLFWGNIFFPMGFLLLFSHQMLRHTIRFSKKGTLLTIGSYSLLLVLISYFYISPYNPWHHPLVFSIPTQIAAFFLLYTLYRVSAAVSVFTYFLIKGFLDSTFLLTKILQFYLFFEQRHLDETASFCYAYLLTLLATFPLMLFFIRKLLRPLILIDAQHYYWHFICFIPVANYFVYILGISPAYSSPQLIFDHTNVALPLCWICSTFLTYVLLSWMLLHINRDTLHIHDLETEALCLSMEQRQYDKIQQQYEETRQIRHDVRHHLLILRKYFEEDNRQAMADYLSSYLDSIELHNQPVCEIPSINAIASYYQGLAEKNGTDLSFSLSLSKDLPIPDMDFGILLGNLLENAWEACVKQKNTPRFIRVNGMQTSPSMLFLSVENSYEGTISLKDNRFFSSKREGFGIGTSSVRHMAQRYHGDVSYRYENQVFCATVYLNFQKEP